jgi:hypothetical protein
VIENVGVVAAGILERIRENRHLGEVACLVDVLRQ